MRHATCWYGFKRTEVDQSCFKTFTGLRSGSLKYAPARQFAGKWQKPTLEKKKKKKKKKTIQEISFLVSNNFLQKG